MQEELRFCKICNQEISKLAHFYRNHDLKLEEYIVKYFPRTDLFDKSPIIYKTTEQYFSADFNNKNNLKQYLKNLSKIDATNYCKDLLRKRKIEKDLKYCPLQIELVSLPCFPPVNYLSTLFNYYEFCEEIGLINKVKSISDFNLQIEDTGDNYIIIDSRENQPLKFDIECKVEKLEFGDYHFTGNSNLYFERKSLPDFCSTLSCGLERFIKELERARLANAYLIMIVESKLQDALSFNHLPWMKRVKTKATPEFLFHNLRELIQRFPNFQPLFVDGRPQVVEYMMKGFLSGNIFKQYDLGLLYQLKLI